MGNDLPRRSVAEFFGTFWLVFGGCGAAVLAAGFPNLGIGFVGVSLAFGLTVLTMAYAVGHISAAISTRRSRLACGALGAAPPATVSCTSLRRLLVP